jgi:hypothetical protein
MSYHYSRRTKIENKKNIRNTYIFGILTIAAILLLFFFGLPAIVKFSAFIGEIRQSSEAVSVDDTTPPAPPNFNTYPEYTKDLSVEISGTAESGSSVIITFNSKESEVIVNKEGGFSKTFDLQRGINIFSAIAKDSSGNESQKTENNQIVFDNTPPELEIIKPNSGSQYYGSTERQLVIEGTTEEDAEMTINDRFVSVSDEGNYTFATTLEEGENTFTIKASDQAGNTTEKTLTVTFTP